MTSQRNHQMLGVLGALVALASIGWWMSRGSDSDPEPEPRTQTEPRDGARHVGSSPASDEAPPRPPEGEASDPAPTDPAPTFDPAERARVLYDGGIPAEMPAYDPPAEPAPTAPVAAAPFDFPRTGRTTPPDARTVLRSARFWRGLLEQRIDVISAQRAAARASGNTAAEQRASRTLERLRAQEPAIEQRIAELEAVVPPDEGEAPGEP